VKWRAPVLFSWGLTDESDVKSPISGSRDQRVASSLTRRSRVQLECADVPEHRIHGDVSIEDGLVLDVSVLALVVVPHVVVGDREVIDRCLHPDPHAGADPFLMPTILNNDVVG